MHENSRQPVGSNNLQLPQKNHTQRRNHALCSVLSILSFFFLSFFFNRQMCSWQWPQDSPQANTKMIRTNKKRTLHASPSELYSTFIKLNIILSNVPFWSVKSDIVFPLKNSTLNYTALSKISMNGFKWEWERKWRAGWELLRQKWGN